MKKIILFVMVILILFPVDAFPADNIEIKAHEGSIYYEEQLNSLNTQDLENYINELNSETSGYIPELNFKDIVNVFKTGNINYSIKDILLGLLNYFISDVLLNTKLLGQLITLTIICSILQNLEKAFNNDSVSSLAYYACYLVIIILVIKSFILAVDIGRDTINRMVDFMLALVPALLTLLASVGGFASASIFDPIIMAAVQTVSNIVRDFILPIIFLTAVLNIVNNLSDTFQVSKLSGLLKQVCVWTLGFTLTIFIGIITIRGATSQTIDQVAVKTAKFAIDNFIPVIGKCLSDAAGTIAGYSLILKDAVSTVGLIALVITCAFPLIKIVSLMLIYRITCALIEPLADKRIVSCLNDVANSLTLVFASVVCVAVMFFIMVTIIASTGKAAVMI